MLKNKYLIYKVLPIIAITILLSFIFSSNCYASSCINYTDNIPNSRHYEKTIYVPTFPVDLTNKRFFITYSNGSLGLYVVKEEYENYIIFDKNNDGYDFFLVNDLNNRENYGYFDFFYCSCGLNDLLSEYKMSNKTWSNVSTKNMISGYIEEQIYCNTNVYYSNGEYYFFIVPVQEIVEIPALETVEQIPQVITTVLKMIIPIGLVILSMVLIIYLIKSVIWRMK